MTTPDFSGQSTWAAGDFSKVGVSSVLVSELLCEAVVLRAGERVLDVATGAGNTALAAARRATDVVGVDFVPALLERARERAHAEHLHRITFQEGANDALPFPDHSFDVVLSTFGHMFTPDPMRAAAEMVRVARPGGRLGFTAWTPRGFNGAMFALWESFGDSSTGRAVTMWGRPEVVRDRFQGHGHAYTFTERWLTTRALSFADWLARARENLGPVRVLWERMTVSERDDFAEQAGKLVAEFNQSGDQTVFLPSAYLESVVHLK